MRSSLLVFLALLPTLFSQNTNDYLGPETPSPKNLDLVRVQVLIYNSPSPKGDQIESVQFDGTSIPLKPRDIHGFRGQGSFQKAPGKYKLVWKINRDNASWPRTVTKEQEVFLDSRDLWIQITVIGDEASIS